ncbi:hypothetical protein B0I33_106239 [Prauserella shujinwangii]|uniref:Uncharacterized protein n=1 Tax=Prauserella shujinwangii TaxID=1453103 RepID=A0A2T0LTS6_9PSEU|nr:hypothetical protein [Prauserella shujinwangii]PRX47140.1 hypothetical protein B0I33_106239 [Prauserella shujinwangii]
MSGTATRAHEIIDVYGIRHRERDGVLYLSHEKRQALAVARCGQVIFHRGDASQPEPCEVCYAR